MEYFLDYLFFFAKIATFAVVILILLAASIGIARSGKTKAGIKITKLNEKLSDLKEQLKEETATKAEMKQWRKEEKKAQKGKAKDKTIPKKVFVLDFKGDIKASQITSLREEITAVLTVATEKDEVVVNIESGGGVVHGYGLCASQLHRLKEKNIPLTVTVDKVAASGGYLMACVANKIIAAPFSIIGSIGVLAQLPNFHRLLKEHRIDFEQLSAGEYKRTLTLFGENTPKAREKVQEELEETHELFKEYIHIHRPILNLKEVATGEYWLGTKALTLKLIDALGTSDDYLIQASETADIFKVEYAQQKSLSEKFTKSLQLSVQKFFQTWRQEENDSRLL